MTYRSAEPMVRPTQPQGWLPIHTLSQIGLALRARRKEAGLTQSQAGGRTGLLPKTVSGLETAPDHAMLKSFFLLLSALDLEIVLRVKGENNPDDSAEW